jgi:hypothetical protein
MVDLDAMGKGPWPTWPVDKKELRDLLGEIDWLRALAAHNIQLADHHVAEKYDALDEIERLRAALREIAAYDTDADGNWGFFRDEADAALEGETTND